MDADYVLKLIAGRENMSLFTRSELISRAEKSGLTKTASAILEKQARAFDEKQTYDIFMSHSSLDALEILGLKLEIEDFGYSVYVDWLEDSQLDRANVTKDTALHIQKRMKQCESLFFALSTNSSGSKWMPWELGYFDGYNGKVAILPVREDNIHTENYSGQQYLGIYPYVTKAMLSDKTKLLLWINTASDTYIDFNSFLKGNQPQKH